MLSLYSYKWLGAMETICLNNEVATAIYLEGNLERLPKILGKRNAVLIADEHVATLLKERLPKLLTYTVASGEHSKSLREASEIYRWLQNNGIDRDTVLVGLGGGVVCDLSGFVAATYMRGIPLVLIPTTLLAQVDASVGGKNAVNLDGFKNIVGTFYQPEAILCDYSLLNTLPLEEIRGGVAEMIKHCMIADATMFDYFHAHAESILRLDPEVVREIIPWSIRIKKNFIEADLFDHGIRRILNFGHTWGHAVESVTGIHHGLAVAIGMCFATRFAVHKGYCDAELLAALESLLIQFGLPTRSDVLPWVVFEAMKRDKKRSASDIHFILPETVGLTTVVDVSIEELKSFIKTL